MATKLYDDTNFTNIANAIRNKLGKNTTYKPRNMASAIYSILTAQEVYPTDTASSNTNEVTIIDGANKGRFTSFRVAIPPYRNGSGDPTPTNIRRYAVTGGAGRFYNGNTMVSFTYTHNIIGGYFDLAQKKIQSSFEPRLLNNYEVKTFTDNGVTIFYVDWWGTGDSPKILGCEYLKYVGDFSSLSEACANMPNNSIGGAKDAASGSYFCFMRADDFSTPEAFKEAIGLYSIMIACDYLYDDDDFSNVDTFMKNIVRGKSSYKVEILTNTFGSSEVWQGVNIGTNFMADPELYKDKAIMDLLPQDTASGSIANFPDGSDGYPVVELKANIEPIQEGTGDPSPSNVRPISGRSSCKVTRAGKNLFEKNNYSNFTKIFAYDVLKYTLPNETLLTMVFKDKDTSVDISNIFFGFVANSYNGGNLQNNQFHWTLQNGAIRSRTDNTSEDNTALCSGIILYPATEEAYNRLNARYNISIVVGNSTATDYEAYQGEDYIIPLGEDPIYGGVLNVTTGVLTITRIIRLIKNNTWTYNPDYKFFQSDTISDIKPVSNWSEISTAICEVYKTVSGSQGLSENLTLALAPYSNQLRIHDENYTTSADLLEAVGDNVVCYELATPIEIQLTPEEVTTLLGTNNIFADSGDVEVKYRADIALYIEKIQNS